MRITRPSARTLVALSAVGVMAFASACGTDATDDAAAGSSAASTASATPSAESEPSASETTEATESAEPAESEKAEDAAGEASMAGQYITYGEYEMHPDDYADGKVVLFFHADWCPTCRATEKAIDADGVPDGLTVVKVDYDTATELKQKYGVTIQHTYVQVDDAGMSLKKWTGSGGGEDILAETV